MQPERYAKARTHVQWTETFLMSSQSVRVKFIAIDNDNDNEIALCRCELCETDNKVEKLAKTNALRDTNRNETTMRQTQTNTQRKQFVLCCCRRQSLRSTDSHINDRFTDSARVGSYNRQNRTTELERTGQRFACAAWRWQSQSRFAMGTESAPGGLTSCALDKRTSAIIRARSECLSSFGLILPRAMLYTTERTDNVCI